MAAPFEGREPINTFSETVALTIGVLLPIMNPFSTAPLFVSLTANFDPVRRKHQAFMACIYAFCILAAFLLVGGAIIDFFRISIAGIRVAGGLIVTTIGFRMLFPSPPPAVDPAAKSPGEEPDIAFTPIAMPSLAGPGSISAVLSAAAQIKSMQGAPLVVIYGAVLTGMALTLVFSYGVLRTATALVRFLGPGGLDAMSRILGFLLICVGMQFLLTGINDFYHILPR